MKFFKVPFAAIVGAVLLASAPVSAASLSCSITETPGNSPNPQTRTFTLGHALEAECFSGNDTNQIDANFLMFTQTGWILADKNDDTTSGDSAMLFTQTGPSNNGTSGSWGINQFIGDVVITLKAGNFFGAFLVDQTVGLTGTWTTSQGLSHASVYYRQSGGSGPGPNPIPLPAAAWLLLSGIGGLGVMGWRKRRAAA